MSGLSRVGVPLEPTGRTSQREGAALCNRQAELVPAAGLESARVRLQSGCSPSELCWLWIMLWPKTEYRAAAEFQDQLRQRHEMPQHRKLGGRAPELSQWLAQ